MAASAERRPRRGPAPIASFDHDVSDESSPENKQAGRLPEIREDPSFSSTSVAACAGDSLAPPEQRARSHSSPAVHAAASPAAPPAPPAPPAAPPAPPATGLQTPAAPRIDISRASSSSHHDSRDSSPELALFAGTGTGEDARARLELGFREDGALDLRSSTEELAFLEGAPGGPEPRAPPPAPPAPPARRHSRKDSQGSEAALLGVSGRTSRLSSVGSQCSAHSALSAFSHASRVSRLSVASGASRSPSPHKMLLETSFCGPKPIETDPEICAAAVEERLLEIAQLAPPAPAPAPPPAPPVDARDRREVRTEVTLESARPASAPRLASPGAPPPTPAPCAASSASLDDDKRSKETRNRAKVEEHRARSRERKEPSRPEVYRRDNRTKDIIRIKLKPDDEYDDDDEDENERTMTSGEPARKPATLELSERAAHSLAPVSPAAQRPARDSRTPSPTGAPVSRKSSFCSLFKSRETIASPDSPSDALRRKKSLNEGRSRSKSRDRSATPTSAGKIKGSVLSLFKTPRKSAASPSPSSRDASPVVHQQRQFPQAPAPGRLQRGEKLKYYEDAKNGIIHIPLRTPPDELDSKVEPNERLRDAARPASAPQPRPPLERQPGAAPAPAAKPIQRTVLPDGSIIIPLHSPTEKTAGTSIPTASTCELTPPAESRISVHGLEPEIRPGLAEPDGSTPGGTEPSPDAGPDASPPGGDAPAAGPSASPPGGDAPAAGPAASPPGGDAPAAGPAASPPGGDAPAAGAQPRRKERIIFTTHVGSKEQVFSTQFSITKTPSVTSEISESIPSFPESEEVRSIDPPWPGSSAMSRDEPLGDEDATGAPSSSPPPEPGRDSSGSEASSDAAATRGGSEAERRGLVVQESFEELPYVPTTLPLERSLALPMVPVRERGGVRVAGLQRPRARGHAAPLPALPSPGTLPAPAAADAASERLHIRLPRRARAASAAGAAPPPRAERARSRSGGDATGAEPRGKGWIDFSEVPERRKQPKRIQTLPAAARDAVVFSYVPPERCRCECHAHGAHAADDELPLLDAERLRAAGRGASSPECEEDGGRVQVNVHIAPFTADLDLRHNHTEAARPH